MAMTLISSQTLTSSAASVTFSSIPQTFKSLRLVVSARADISTDNGIFVRFNGDGGNNYTYRILYGTGASAASTNVTSTSRALIGILGYSTDTASTFGSSEALIPNYSGSAAKAFSVDGVNETNATTAYQDLAASIWSQTSAITSLALLPGSGNFVSGSTFTLYGLA